MNVYITLDYELFLGDKTGTPENCLIRPMDELCKIANKHNVKFVIFVDATYLLRMQQLSGRYKEVDRQYDLVSRHVKTLAEQGHDIELHFHPQWLYSNWDEITQQWKMDKKHYKLSDLDLEEAKTSLRAAKELLDSIVGYKTVAYRAGGFCLDSFTEYKEIFEELGLKVDSSVARGLYVKSPIHCYDYRNIPADQIYIFSESNKVTRADGSFVELSISSVRWNALFFVKNIRPLQKAYNPSFTYGDGRGISDGKSLLIHRIKKIFIPSSYLASIDGRQSCYLKKIYECVRKKQSDFVIIGHPKFLTDESKRNIVDFLAEELANLSFKTTRSLL